MQPQNEEKTVFDDELTDEVYEKLTEEAAAYDYDVARRFFVYRDEKSDKFWHVNHIGSHYYVHYGKNGTFGRIEVKEADSEDACKKIVDKTIAEKLAKGYVESVGTDVDDAFQQAKSGCRPALDSLYVVFSRDEPIIYIAAIKAACEHYCDLMRLAKGNREKILQTAKAAMLCLNQYAQDPELLETDEREILFPWMDEVAMLAGYEDADDLAGEWREW